jgi:hypothetical protein
MAYSEVMWFCATYIRYKRFPELRVHPLYIASLLRVNCVTILLIIGIGLYLFKQQSKLLYGISETAIAIVSNLALIQRIDLSHPPAIHVATADAVAIGVFTYLLSRGLANAVEGADETRKKPARFVT